MQELNSRDKELSPQQERVAELLGSGCSAKQVADATGFSLGYISQLGKKDEVKRRVGEVKGSRVGLEVERRGKFDKLEVGLLDGIRARMGTADMSELTRALDVVSKNNPNRGSGGIGNGGGGGEGTVTISLPAHVLTGLSIETNARNEVIEVGGRSMQALTPKAIESRLADE